MNSSRIQDFQLANPGKQFPWFRTLDARETNSLYSRLCAVVDLPANADGLELVQTIEKAGTILTGAELRDFSGDIQHALQESRVVPRSNVYVNWYRFDEIDEFHFDDILRWFPDLWYTAAEDPDIFDDSLTWMLSLRHYRAFILRKF